MGGDRLRLEVEVGPFSTLVLREVSSTLLLPGVSGEESLTEVNVRVGEGATFVWLPEPVIAAHGCRHRMDVRVALQTGARLLLREELVLGRHGEEPGDLSQRLRLRLDGSPLYDQELAVGPGAEGWSGAAVTAGHRTLGSVVVVDPVWGEGFGERPPAVTLEGEAALMPLAVPATLLSALAPDTVELRRRLAAGMTLLNREDQPTETASAEVRG
jgi:urease accessory protein